MPICLMEARSSASACGEGYGWRERSGFPTSACGSIFMRYMRCSFGVAGRLVAGLFRLPPEDTLRPAERTDRCNCDRASLPGRDRGVPDFSFRQAYLHIISWIWWVSLRPAVQASRPAMVATALEFLLPINIWDSQI